MTLLDLPELDVEKVFPSEIAEAMVDIAFNYQVPVELPVFAFIAISAGVIGNSSILKLIDTENDTWKEPSVLWVALTGYSGIGKSSVLSYLLRPIKQLQVEWFKKYSEEKQNSETAKLRQIIVDDSTLEGVAAVLQSNAQGVLWVRDELTGLLADFERYIKGCGGTKSRLLSSYNAEHWFITRKSTGHIFIPCAAISVLGSLTPYSLKRIYDPTDGSGWLQRWQYVVIRHQEKVFKVPEIKQSTTSILQHILITLVEMREQDMKVLTPSQEALKVYGNYYNTLNRNAGIRIMNDHFGWAAKHLSRVLRFALVLQNVQNTIEGRHSSVITEQTMRRAIELGQVALEHQLVAMSIMEGRLRSWDGEKNEVLVKVSKAILHLVNEADQEGRLPTSTIVAKLKSMELDISAHTLGKILRELGFDIFYGRYQGGKGARCIQVDEKKLNRLLKFITEAPDLSETRETTKL